MLTRALLKGKIRPKILRALLGIALISLVSFAIVSLNGMLQLGEFAVKTNTGLGNAVLKINKSALETLVKDGLQRITVDRANLCNAEFMQIEAAVCVLADIAEKIWKSPQAYPIGSSYGYDEPPKNPSSVGMYQFPKNVDANLFKNEIELSSSLDAFFKPLQDNNPNINDFNFATPNGLFRRFPWGAVSPEYDVRKRNWFRRAVDSGRQGWSDPYVGAIAKNLRINFSKPIFHNNQLVAVVAINVPLKTINERIISTRLNNHGTALLVDRNLRIIAKEGMSTNAENWEEIEQLEQFALDSDSPLKKKFEADLNASKPGILLSKYKGSDCYIAYAPLETTKWSMLFIMPLDAINAPFLSTEKEIMQQAETLKEQVKNKIRISLMELVTVFLIILIAVYVVAYRLAGVVTKPILELDQGVRIIGDGNLEYRIKIDSGDEIEELANTFNKMTSDLKEYIENLTEATASKERIQSELQLATDIQASLLPRIFPAFPSRDEFDIYASMDPAKEIGGDFYDFFFIDDNNLCFLIADVADKGVPAALYMMVAKTLLKSEGQRLGEPDQLLEYVNNILAVDNDNCMFVTVFCAILDVRTGEVRFGNAGHNPPLLLDSYGIRYLTVKAGFVLGPIPDSSYEAERIFIKPGDMLFLYTDGVTEAKNPESALYGEARLLNALQSCPKESLSEMIFAIREDVARHANGAPQSDDVTMLAIRYQGASNA